MLKEKWNKLAQTENWVSEALNQMDEETMHDAFYKSLEFGTAGMRGLLGAGPNRMNVYTVGKATLGFAKYLKETFSDRSDLKVAIAFDNRHQSVEFAKVSADILSGFGIKSYVYKDPRPTPQLSFTVRDLDCVAGIMVTASHNPKEYNGYKVYDETGCQLVDHKIKRVIELINEHEDETTVDVSTSDESLLEYLGRDYDFVYEKKVKEIQLRPDEEKKVSIIFSSQHGSALPVMSDIFDELKYDVTIVKEQAAYDPDFTNTKTPNPEDKASYDLAIEYAKRFNADLILSCDPDADRMGVVVNHKGEFVYLSGNQGGSVLQEYLYSSMKELDLMPQNPIMYNTIVTSDLGEKIAKSYDVEVKKTLTGFKYIGEQIENNPDKDFVFGYEESYGYLIKEFVRDKDAIQACLMLAEAANYYKAKNLTLVDVLNSLYDKFGVHHEVTESVAFEGEEGLKKIQTILKDFRESNIESIAGVKVVEKQDFLSGKTSKGETIDLPSSNVLKFLLEDGSWIAVRPSGTEPKCKFYYCVIADSDAQAIKKYEQFSNEIKEIAHL